MKKITQKQLSSMSGLSQPFLSEVLSGVKTPSPKAAARLEKASGWHRLFWLYPNEYDKQGNRLADEPLPRQ